MLIKFLSMAFEYSSFISYRRENQRNIFIEKFCQHFSTYAWDACNISGLFHDVNSIKVGNEFDEKIYEGIRNSCFFTLIHNPHYLNEKNNWCAKELKYAIDVENQRKKLLDKEDIKNYKWIFPLIITGSANDLPNSLSTRNAKNIRCYMAAIQSNKLPQKVIDFFTEIQEEMYSLYQIYTKYNTKDFNDCCKSIKYPTDKEISVWINKQKTRVTKSEKANLPLLSK